MTTQRTAASGTTPIGQLFRDEHMEELEAKLDHVLKLLAMSVQNQLMLDERIARLEGHKPSGIVQRLANIELGTDHP